MKQNQIKRQLQRKAADRAGKYTAVPVLIHHLKSPPDPEPEEGARSRGETSSRDSNKLSCLFGSSFPRLTLFYLVERLYGLSDTSTLRFTESLSPQATRNSYHHVYHMCQAKSVWADCINVRSQSGGSRFKTRGQEVNLNILGSPNPGKHHAHSPAPRSGQTRVRQHADSWTPRLGSSNNTSGRRRHNPRHSSRKPTRLW